MLTTQLAVLKEVKSDNTNPHYLCTYSLNDGAETIGQFSHYHNPALRHLDHKVVCVGQYFCIDDNSIAQQLLSLIDQKCGELRYTYVIGPMEGSTWEDYRFSLNSEQKSFALDIAQPQYYNEQFKLGGFNIIGQYCSSTDTTLKERPTNLTDVYWNNKGITIRSIALDKLDDDLHKIAELTNEAFRNNFLFTAIEPRAFVKKYSQLKQLLDSRYILLAEDKEGSVVAYLFAIVDPQDTTNQTLIIKTIAVSQSRNCRGLGGYLAGKTISKAKRNGIKKIIHAFMHKTNISLNTSKHYGTPYKEYALYGKAIK